ncbi:hypothetical protein H6G91_34705 [Nostoc muscorum FACHB-395]|nr:hypothetical protein [Desmonostoc muscorum FACHB-395]
MNSQAALTLNKFITSAADKPGCTLSQQPPAAKLARMTDTKAANSDRRCGNPNSSTSLQSCLPTVATRNSEGLLGTRGVSGGALWGAGAERKCSMGSVWRCLVGWVGRKLNHHKQSSDFIPGEYQRLCNKSFNRFFRN